MKAQAPFQAFQKDYPYTTLEKAAQTTQEMEDALLNPLLCEIHPLMLVLFSAPLRKKMSGNSSPVLLNNFHHIRQDESMHPGCLPALSMRGFCGVSLFSDMQCDKLF